MKKSDEKIRRVKRESNARTLVEIREMLEEAKERKATWKGFFHSGKLSTKKNATALRNYTALRGVVKTLEWALGEEESPLS
mgnify:CR=1 FL=1|tara:strand:- start:885 stop:1127 length:243 start_codon:yes stop_codon:yes gene_type:complete